MATWVTVGLIAWGLVAPPVAILVGKSISRADQQHDQQHQPRKLGDVGAVWVAPTPRRPR